MIQHPPKIIPAECVATTETVNTGMKISDNADTIVSIDKIEG